MPKEQTPLTLDMFTNEWIDNRTSAQKKADSKRNLPKQMLMFKQREIVQVGTKFRPIFDISKVSPGELVLEMEDVRTEQEKEQDLQCQAEALTPNMFADEPVLDEIEDKSTTELDVADDIKKPESVSESPKSPKLSAYLDVISAMEEQLTTLWIDQTYQTRLASQLAKTILDAHSIGLTREEIDSAVKIGEHMGREARQQAEKLSPTSLAQKNGNQVTLIYDASNFTKSNTVPSKGFRAKSRRTNISLRRRNVSSVA